MAGAQWSRFVITVAPLYTQSQNISWVTGVSNRDWVNSCVIEQCFPLSDRDWKTGSTANTVRCWILYKLIMLFWENNHSFHSPSSIHPLIYIHKRTHVYTHFHVHTHTFTPTNINPFTHTQPSMVTCRCSSPPQPANQLQHSSWYWLRLPLAGKMLLMKTKLLLWALSEVSRMQSVFSDPPPSPSLLLPHFSSSLHLPPSLLTALMVAAGRANLLSSQRDTFQICLFLRISHELPASQTVIKTTAKPL